MILSRLDNLRLLIMRDHQGAADIVDNRPASELNGFDLLSVCSSVREIFFHFAGFRLVNLLGWTS